MTVNRMNCPERTGWGGGVLAVVGPPKRPSGKVVLGPVRFRQNLIVLK